MKNFLSFYSFRRAQKLYVLQVPRFFVALQQPTQMQRGQELDAFVLCILDVRLWKICLSVIQMVTSFSAGSCIPIVYSVFLILTFVTCLISWGSGQYHLEMLKFFFFSWKLDFVSQISFLSHRQCSCWWDLGKRAGPGLDFSSSLTCIDASHWCS